MLISLNEGQSSELEFRGANEEWVDVERGESLEAIKEVGQKRLKML